MMKSKPDRVSWRRAWSLFYKLLIMQLILGVTLWLMFIVITNSNFDSTQNISTKQNNYSKYDECFADALENNKDVNNCSKYLPSE